MTESQHKTTTEVAAPSEPATLPALDYSDPKGWAEANEAARYFILSVHPDHQTIQ